MKDFFSPRPRRASPSEKRNPGCRTTHRSLPHAAARRPRLPATRQPPWPAAGRVGGRARMPGRAPFVMAREGGMERMWNGMEGGDATPMPRSGGGNGRESLARVKGVVAGGEAAREGAQGSAPPLGGGGRRNGERRGAGAHRAWKWRRAGWGRERVGAAGPWRRRAAGPWRCGAAGPWRFRAAGPWRCRAVGPWRCRAAGREGIPCSGMGRAIEPALRTGGGRHAADGGEGTQARGMPRRAVGVQRRRPPTARGGGRTWRFAPKIRESPDSIRSALIRNVV